MKPVPGLEARLIQIDASLAVDPTDVALLYERGRIAWALGRVEEARLAFMSVLARVPAHFGALADYGVLLFETGARAEALRLYREIARLFPDRVLGHINLGFLLLEDRDFAGAREQYEAAVSVDTGNLDAHQGLAVVLASLGDDDGAERHRRIAFERRPLRVLPYRGDGEPVRVLQLVSAAGGNIPTSQLLDDTTFLVTTLVADYYDPDKGLPSHHAIFNAIGDADLAHVALTAAAKLFARTKVPTINDPAAVALTARAINADRLRDIDGVTAPRMTLIDKSTLAGNGGAALLRALGFQTPFLVRAPGFHTGQFFERIDRDADIASAIASFPGNGVLAVQYLDTASSDGFFRKYRAMIVDGALYPLHLAISSHWMVHYVTSDMAGSPSFRAEEAAFLDDMRGTIGPENYARLERVRDLLGLDFGGIDFALAADGTLVVFEANATMNVLAHDANEDFAYRGPAAERIRAATRAMLLERAGKAVRA